MVILIHVKELFLALVGLLAHVYYIFPKGGLHLFSVSFLLTLLTFFLVGRSFLNNLILETVLIKFIINFIVLILDEIANLDVVTPVLRHVLLWYQTVAYLQAFLAIVPTTLTLHRLVGQVEEVLVHLVLRLLALGRVGGKLTAVVVLEGHARVL